MALIPRKKKVKEELSKFDVQWDVYNDRQEFHLILNGRDISDRVEVEFAREGEMVIFDPETSMYFYLRGIDEVPENESQIAKGVIAPEGIVCIAIDGLKTYYCFYKGENISKKTDSFWVNEDLGLWIPELKRYFLFPYRENPIDDELIAPHPIKSDNGTLWYKDGKGSFWFLVNGVGIASNCNNAWVDKDLLLYDRENENWYYFVEYDSVAPFEMYKAAILPVQGKNLWLRSSEKGNYRFYKEGQNISGDTNAVYYGDDMIVFVNQDNAHYLMKNFRKVKINNLYEPILLPNNSNAIWLKFSPKEFYLWVKGQNISGKVTTKMMDGNLLCLNRSTKMIYICGDFDGSPVNEFLPAATMEAGKFMHYFN